MTLRAFALDSDARERLTKVLTRARDLGFLGPGPVGPHVDRAVALAAGVPDAPGTALDLGSGGGVPGLPLALIWPESKWVLLDGSTKRSAFLEAAVVELDLDARVRVVASRAETAGRTELRGTFELVVARSFASPGVTAECGSPFLKVGGRLVVAEPPGGEMDRWDPSALATLGLELIHSTAPGAGTAAGTGAGAAGVGGAAGAGSAAASYQALVQVTLCPEKYPRRVGIPAKRPLF